MNHPHAASLNQTSLGAVLLDENTCRFRVWAPHHREVRVVLGEREVPLQAMDHGYHEGVVKDVRAGSRYKLRLLPRENGPVQDEQLVPDPASRHQPEGPHGPSEVVDLAYAWRDTKWRGRAFEDYVIYEIHVGTFTEAGTFDSAIDELDRLVELGVTAVEIMPIAQFSGNRNWGYDGVDLYAAQNSYGGPAGLMRLVDACHARGLAVVLDVVYNHLGPEGNYLSQFGPYFNADYHTPWGPALNYDGHGSDEVRRFFLENSLMWLRDFHIDALRLDAVHGIVDMSAYPFLAELSDVVAELGAATNWRRYLMAESDTNDRRLLTPTRANGIGMNGVWADEFHHCVHVLLTGETDGYYHDYAHRELLVRAINNGFAFTGQYSEYRGRRHGSGTVDIPPEAFVVCVQNHDQIGNRFAGDRLSTLTDLAGLKLAAGLLLLSPHMPLLFMGEEYGEKRPFQYFVSHGDPGLVEAVRKGRKAEFAAFGWDTEPPDPVAEETFASCKIAPQVRTEGEHAHLNRLYTALLSLRQRPEFRRNRKRVAAQLADNDATLLVALGDPVGLLGIFNLENKPRTMRVKLPQRPGWRPMLESEDPKFGGAEHLLREGDALRSGELELRVPPRYFAILAPDEQA